MYNQEDYNSNQLFPFSTDHMLAKASLGLVGLTGIGFLNRAYNDIRDMPGVKKFLPSQRHGAFRKMMKGFKEDFGMYSPYRTREANEIDMAIHEFWGRNNLKGTGKGYHVKYDTPINNSYGAKYAHATAVRKNAKVYKAPFGVAMGLFSMGWEMDAKQGSLTGVATGAAKEVGGLAGARIGAFIGSIGGPVGAGVGMLAGGALGVMGVDWIGKAAKMGRRWSMPELGGNFRDSMESMTMRQRALNSIRTSQFNVRNALGNEASFLQLGYY